ncbi:MAG: minor capsid protein [Pyrinomonadaceae bacterium]
MNAYVIQYNAKLQRIVRMVKRDIDAHVLPVIKQQASEYTLDAIATTDGWLDSINSVLDMLKAKWSGVLMAQLASRIAGDFVQVAVKKSERDLKKSAGLDVFSQSPGLSEYLRASADQNASLIESIPAQYLDQVSTLVVGNMRAGMRPGFIAKALQQQFGVTERRAKFIARDQAGKIQGDLNERQQKSVGIEYFRWLDSDDSRVRHKHEEIANKVTAFGVGVYSWSSLPLSEKGEPIKPGQDYNCRCTAIPVSEQQVKRNQDAGNVAPGVYR